jgi:transcriptional regulator
MEEMIDLEEFMASIVLPETKYVAVFDPDTGAVTSVGPSYAFSNEKFILDLDDETALSIIEGRTKIHSCFVDPTSNTLELSEVKTVVKMDDVLHRIVERQWSDIEKPDLYITYKDNTLTFQLTEELHGTYILDAHFQPVKKRKVRWDGDTQLHFFVTEYNDPNILHKSVVITLSDIIEKSHTVEVLALPDKFSVYTRRIFKNYVIEKL